MRLKSSVFALSLMATTALAGGALADERVALVVSNNAYKPLGALETPHRDAQLISESLKDAGFTKIIEARDLGRTDFTARLEEFKREAAKADVAVIYFAGHGFEVDRVNYLAPVDAAVRALKDVPEQLIPLDTFKASVNGAKKLKILILDACRKDDFAELFAGEQGLRTGNAKTAASETGLIVAFSAAEGQYASDGEEGASNSPFADALAKRIATPGIEIGNLFRVVHDDVRAATKAEQSPAYYASLTSETFYLIPPPVDAPTAANMRPGDAKTAEETELEYWKAASELNEADLYQVYLDKVASGEFRGVFKEVAAVKMKTAARPDADAEPAPPTVAAAAPSTTTAAAAAVQCTAGAKVEVLWEGKWYPAVARAANEADGRCPIAYDGYSAQWNESVTPERLRAPQPQLAAAPPTDAEKARMDEAKTAVAAAQAAMAKSSYTEAAGEFEKATRLLARVPDMKEMAAATALFAGTNHLLDDKGGTRAKLRAARMFRRSADLGQAGGAVAYAYMLRTGHGVAKNEVRARAVLKPFAEAGDAGSMAQYGRMLLLGQGGARDTAAGRGFIEKSALAGNNHGMQYWGDLVRRDKGDAAAAEWYRRSAEKDNTKAMLALGRLLLWSKEMPRNRAEGMSWLQKAADQLEWDAAYELARIKVADPDPKVQEEGGKLAQLAALSLNADYAIYFAGLLERGVGVKKDLAKARVYYENATMNGNRYQRRRAQLELAELRGS